MFGQRLPDGVDVFLANIAEHDVLIMRHTCLVEAVAIGEIRHHVELFGRDVARYAADRLERSEEHTSELQSLMRISYAVFCLKKKIEAAEDHTIQHRGLKYIQKLQG